MRLSIKEKLNFTLRVVVIHSVTYLICGFLLHQLFDYASIFSVDIIKNYMRPVSDPVAMAGPFLQPIRGLLFALGLWLIKPVWISKKHGWLIIWGVIFLFGILNTPAAAPSSIEGYIYSRIPLWYHLMGYVEVGIQTLLFSLLVFTTQQAKEQNKSLFTRFPLAGEVVRAIALSCFAYIGYAISSISLLFTGGYTLEFKETSVTTGSGKTINISETAGDLTIQFMFVTTFLINLIFVFLYHRLLKDRKIHGIVLFLMIMGLNITTIFFYQLIFSSVPDPLTLAYLPSLASLILTYCLKKDVFSPGEKAV